MSTRASSAPPAPDPSLAALLRAAGYDLPAAQVGELEPGHALLVKALSLVGAPPPEAEPAITFRATAPA